MQINISMKFKFVVKHYMNAMSKMYRRGRDIILLTNPYGFDRLVLTMAQNHGMPQPTNLEQALQSEQAMAQPQGLP